MKRKVETALLTRRDFVRAAGAGSAAAWLAACGRAEDAGSAADAEAAIANDIE